MTRINMLFLFLLGLITAEAQPIQKRATIGMGVSFGIVQRNIQSNFHQIDGLSVLQEGGTIFLETGTNFLRVKTGAGFYYSASSVSQTIDLFQAGAQGEFHFFSALRRKGVKWSPFLSAGSLVDRNSFYGFYGGEKGEAINYSIGREPFLGRITTVNGVFGLGISRQWSIAQQYLRVFASAHRGQELGKRATREFESTSLSFPTQFNLGISFGKRY